MIARLFGGSRGRIDRNVFNALRQRLGSEHQIDSQAVVLFKTALAVIPPGVGFGVVQFQVLRVGEAGGKQCF